MSLTVLDQLNREIPLKENAADRAYFKARLAPTFAMRRANAVMVNGDQFLEALREGGDRECRSIDSIAFAGKERAVVTGVVTTGGKAYLNLRLFIRDKNAPEGWLLLAWANEPA